MGGVGNVMDEDGRCKVCAKDAEVLISNYAVSDYDSDLAFSSLLGNEERAVIHRVARKFGLKSKSYGKNENRYLVVSRTPRQKLLILQKGQSLKQAQIIAP